MEAPARTANVNMQEIYSQIGQNESEAKKTAGDLRRIHQEKALSLARENINELRDWQSQLGKAALFGFINGLVSSLAQVAGMLAPGVGAVVTKALEAVTVALNQVNPFAGAAQKKQVKAQEYEQLAKIEESNVQRAAEHLETVKDHRRRLLNDQERIMDNNQKAQEAVLRA